MESSYRNTLRNIILTYIMPIVAHYIAESKHLFFHSGDFPQWLRLLLGKTDESDQGQVVCVGGGRLKSRGKSKRSETPPDGHRSDSTGIVYQFPFQRSSGSVREALRLTRPPELRTAKIFSYLCRCPPSTHTTCPWSLSAFGIREVISVRYFGVHRTKYFPGAKKCSNTGLPPVQGAFCRMSVTVY